ncbi:hypothetical protein D3C75_790280 [compost metagenome]
MFADNGKNINTRIILMSENLNNFTFCRCSAFRITHNTHNDLLTINSTFKGLLRNKNITINPLIIRQHKTIGLQVLKYTYRLQHATFYNTYYFAFHTSAGRTFRGNTNQNDIAIHSSLKIICMDIYVRMITIIRD